VVRLEQWRELDQNVTPRGREYRARGAARRAQVLGGYSFIGLDLAAYQPDSPSLEQGLRSYLDAAKSRPGVGMRARRKSRAGGARTRA
jgi:hypothetical protein